MPRLALGRSSDVGRLSAAVTGWEHRRPASAATRAIVGVLTGEGIGPDVMRVALRVLRAAAERFGFEVELRDGGVIGTEAEQAHGRPLTPHVVGWCETLFADGGAVLCGPGGGRFVYDLRARFDLFCKLTPVRPLPALSGVGPLRPSAAEGVDLVVVRENVGGAYFGTCQRLTQPDGTQEARYTFGYTEPQVRRIVATAVRLAAARRNRLALAVKPNGLPAISELWRRVFDELASPRGVDTAVLEVDNAAYQIVASAADFDVVVAPNLFGDILSDVAALLLGSRGLSCSGNFGGPGVAVYQTGHGAARDLAGRGMANPIGQVFAAAMMLRESFGRFDAADAVEAAVADVLAAGVRTADIADDRAAVVNTDEMGDHIVRQLARQPVQASAAS
jgi:3-isopropylmalate dehydrogenase